MKNLAISIGVLWIMSLAGTGGAKAWKSRTEKDKR
jgi:hypothetical protein